MTVELDPAHVEARLAEGMLACPSCGGRLRGWGWARPRWVREVDRRVRLVPRRTRCRRCAVTHVLLPVFVLARRADAAAVIGAALAARAAGHGHRWIADQLDRPAGTVRGWLRRFASRLVAVEAFFTAAGVAVAVDPVLPVSAGSGWTDAVAAVVWFAEVAAARFAEADEGLLSGGRLGEQSVERAVARGVWAAAAALCHGQLLSPTWPPSRAWVAASASSAS